MKKLQKAACFLLFVFSQLLFASVGDFFEITSSGAPTTAVVTLCLNGKAPLTCQQFTITHQQLSIRTTPPNKTYLNVGIRVETPGFTLSGCQFASSGYCLFSANNSSSTTVDVTPISDTVMLTSITPLTGSASGNEGVTLTGTNLTGATDVTFAGVSAQNVTVVNSTQVTAITPANPVGTVDVEIFTPQGNATLTNGYTYTAAQPTLTHTSPNTGSIAGDTTVSIFGFDLNGASAVTFGGLAAKSFTVSSATKIVAVTKAHGAGAVNVEVTTPGGTATLIDGYTYVTPATPTLDSVSPTTGSTTGGTGVTLIGTNFTAPVTVTFGGDLASNVVVVTSTKVTATTPAHAAGFVDVVLTTSNGSATLTNGYKFITPSGPSLTGISPQSGDISGGTSVTLSGSNLTGATSVAFDVSLATNVVVVNDNTVTATTPGHAAGLVNVVLTTPSGVSTLTNAYNYIDPAAVTLTSVTPNNGTIDGNTNVTLIGTNLDGASVVKFGGNLATGVTVVNSTKVTAITPTHAAGTVDVVINATQGSATLLNGYSYVAPPPTLTSLNPTSGTIAGGTVVTLTGTNLTNTTGVKFGGSLATSITIVSSTTVNATTPSHLAGTVDVVVSTLEGNATLTNSYTYN